MRVLFTVHGYKPAYRIGGPILSVSALAETLVRKGHEVTVFTTNSNLDEDLDVPLDQPTAVDGVEVWYFRRQDWLQNALPWIPYVSKSMGFLYTPDMVRRLDEKLPSMDAAHTHIPFVYPTWATARAARKHGRPLFYHQRGVFDPARLRFRSLKKSAFIAAIEKPTMRAATTLVALTEAEVASYRALGIDTPCRVVPNGIDVRAYSAGEPRRADIRWDLPTDALVVLFLGRLHPIKGADRLLEAFLQVSSRHPDAILVLAGPDEWGLQDRFRDRVRSAGLGARVRFPGMVAGTEKLDLLARANLFSLPSDGEGFSMAVLEALAAETAVLLSPGCHFPEVETEGAGLVAAADANALGAALDRLLGDRARLSGMGARGWALVESRYSWDTITDALLAVYAEGIERHRRLRDIDGATLSHQASA
jgi:glycosyltransferase involved in cell wall biosynthesis